MLCLRAFLSLSRKPARHRLSRDDSRPEGREATRSETAAARRNAAGGRATEPSLGVDFRGRGNGLDQRDDVFSNGMVLDLPERSHEPKAVLELRHIELFGHGNFEARFPGCRKEIGDRYVQYLGYIVEPAAAHTVRAFFVFLHLLTRNAEFVSKVGLRKRQLEPAP